MGSKKGFITGPLTNIYFTLVIIFILVLFGFLLFFGQDVGGNFPSWTGSSFEDVDKELPLHFFTALCKYNEEWVQISDLILFSKDDQSVNDILKSCALSYFRNCAKNNDFDPKNRKYFYCLDTMRVDVNDNIIYDVSVDYPDVAPFDSVSFQTNFIFPPINDDDLENFYIDFKYDANCMDTKSEISRSRNYKLRYDKGLLSGVDNEQVCENW